MKYFIQTYGCQMNFADSERIKTVFEAHGLEEADMLEAADYIVLNSCAIRKKAEDKLFGKGVQITSIKKINSKKSSSRQVDKNIVVYPVVIITGCIVKAGIKGKVKHKTTKDIQNSIISRAKWIDYAVPTNQVFKLLNRILQKDGNVSKMKLEKNIDYEAGNYLLIDPSPYSQFQASLPISVGCNHHCTFCTVPFSRGNESFRNFKSIEKEYKGYVMNNYKQITLLGQTVNKWLNPKYKYLPKAYGWYKMGEILPNSLDGDGNEPDNFLTLLQKLDAVKGNYWLSFISSYPNYFTAELIDFIIESIKSSSGHIMPWIHLALQSGNNEMLKRMHRHYSVQEFMKVVKKFRDRLPDIAITTDIIVGFCNETENEFEDTMEVVREADFDMIYISEYSVRPDTPAEDWEDNIPGEIKKERKEKMNILLDNMLLKRNKRFVGTVQKVLVSDRHHNNLVGKNVYAKDVEVIILGKVRDISEYIGKFVDVEITETSAWSLKGTKL